MERGGLTVEVMELRTESSIFHRGNQVPEIHLVRYSSFESTSTEHIGPSPEAGHRKGTEGGLKQISGGMAWVVVH